VRSVSARDRAAPRDRLRVTAGARAVVLRRCAGACEDCGLEWPWALYLFRRDETRASAAANLLVLCAACAGERPDAFAPLLSEPSLRDRMRAANNLRTGAARLTPARRRRLIAARGGCCEICGIDGAARQLDVHHKQGVLRGGDDSEANLMVLCIACHHHLQPCAAGCGRWARKPTTVCTRCRVRLRLEELYPGLTWDEIKRRHPSLSS